MSTARDYDMWEAMHEHPATPGCCCAIEIDVTPIIRLAAEHLGLSVGAFVYGVLRDQVDPAVAA